MLWDNCPQISFLKCSLCEQRVVLQQFACLMYKALHTQRAFPKVRNGAPWNLLLTLGSVCCCCSGDALRSVAVDQMSCILHKQKAWVPVLWNTCCDTERMWPNLCSYLKQSSGITLRLRAAKSRSLSLCCELKQPEAMRYLRHRAGGGEARRKGRRGGGEAGGRARVKPHLGPFYH